MESRHLVGHPAEVCHVAEEVFRLPAHPVEVRRVATHPMEVCRVATHPMEVCRVAEEVRHVTDHPAEVRRLPAEVRRLPAEVCHLTDHRAEIRHVADHRAEIRHVAGRAAEVCRLADHPVELRGLTVEMRHVAEYLADFAADVGSSCLCSLGTVSMYSFFLFAFTRQLESPFTCHQIVSNGSLQATRVQSRAVATPNGRIRMG